MATFERFTDDKGVEWVRRVVTDEDRLRWAGVPTRFWRYALKPIETEALTLARRMLTSTESILLVLSGGTGCGKSTSCACVLANAGGLWVHAPDLARPDFKGDEETRRESLDDRMRAAKILVLDDVGIEHSPSGYAASRICDVLEFREAHNRKTIVTTNLAGAEFKTKYGERLASRLNGDPIGWQHVGGKDMREARPHWQEERE